MIQLININSAIEKYTFNFISSITNMTFTFGNASDPNNSLSLEYFQKPTNFRMNSIYVYNSPNGESYNENPKYLDDTDKQSIKIPVLFSTYNEPVSNSLFNFIDGKPAIWRGGDGIDKFYLVVNFDLIKNINHPLMDFIDNHRKSNESEQSDLQIGHTFKKYEDQEIPLADYYVNLLVHLINLFKFKQYRLKEIWPHKKKYAVCLTHDVDHTRVKTLPRFLYRSYNNIINRNSLRQKYQDMIDLFRLYSSQQDIYNNFDKWIDVESKYGFHSSFFFLARNMLQSLFSVDRRYSIVSREIKTKIKEIDEQGWEVGLHGYSTAYKNLYREKELLEKVLSSKIIGARQHYLRIKTPETWRFYEKIGIEYDTSLGYRRNNGFRAGTCYPFMPFDMEQNRTVNILVIPLIIMDTVFIDSRLKNNYNMIMDTFMKFKEITIKYGGVLTLLWHQEYYNDFEYEFIKRSYIDILQILGNDNNVFVGSGKEIYNVWKRSNDYIFK